MNTRLTIVALLVALSWFTPAFAQATADLRGEVRDESGAVLPGATVMLRHVASGLERRTVTDTTGQFHFPNVPAGAIDVMASLSGFARHQQRVLLAPNARVEVDVTLALAALTDSVTVTPEVALDTESGGTRHDVSITRIERLPVAASSRGIEAVLVSFPGFSQNANGAIHPRGAHNQMTFVVDGLPISDQLTGAFANALDISVVETAQVITGHVPAEFGGKVSGVAVLSSRSGLGTARRLAGTFAASMGGFRTSHAALQLGGERRGVGYFGSVTALRTDRFLDQVSIDNLHNSGHYVRAFGRVDVRGRSREHLRLHAMGGRSTFDLANLRSQHAAGQDQRQWLDDVSAWAAYQRTPSSTTTIELTGGFRTASSVLTPSAGDTPVTAAQSRRLSTYTVTGRITSGIGAHIVRAGVDLQRFPVRERFSMGLTDSAFNDPASPTYNDRLLPFDLTRGGRPFEFSSARTGTAAGAFAQWSASLGATSLSAGLRFDDYRFLVEGSQWQPRIGLAHRLGGRDVVLRASYNRNFHTPPNENLLLSNSAEAGELAPDSVRSALGGAYRPIRPERQDVVEAGIQFAVARGVTIDAAGYWKRSWDQQDNNNFFDTGIIFPTTLAGIRVVGFESRLTVLPRHGLSGSISATTGRATSTPPFTGGLFLGQEAVDLLSAGPFLIDHDQRLSLHGQAVFDAPGPAWVSGTVRYDSGLVANPSNPVEVAADPDFRDLLPYVSLDVGVARVRPRTVADLAAGLDIVDERGRRTWTAQVQVTNVTGTVALYNFQSVFVGTRLIQPRTISVRVSRSF